MRIGVCAALLLAGAAPCAAQQIRGVAVDTAGRAVPGVAVEIRARAGAVLPVVSTDSAGRFGLTLPAPGLYDLRASRIGYSAIGPTELSVEGGQDLEIVLRMSTDAILLEPVEVTVRPAARSRADEVRNRIEWVRRLGVGSTMTREEIDARAAPTLPSLVGSMSPRVRTVAPITGRETILLASSSYELGVCEPFLYIDGVRVRVDEVLGSRVLAPDNLEAVELYVGAAQAPAQYMAGAECGVVLFWTRVGTDEAAPRVSWKRIALGAAIAALILFVGVH
jgi:hypothetical protein